MLRAQSRWTSVHAGLLLAVLVASCQQPVLADVAKLLGCAATYGFSKASTKSSPSGYSYDVAGENFGFSWAKPVLGPYVTASTIRIQAATNLTGSAASSGISLRHAHGTISSVAVEVASQTGAIVALSVTYGTAVQRIAWCNSTTTTTQRYNLPVGALITRIATTCRSNTTLRSITLTVLKGNTTTTAVLGKVGDPSCGASTAPSGFWLAYLDAVVSAKGCSGVQTITPRWTAGATGEICSKMCFDSRRQPFSAVFDRRILADPLNKGRYGKAPALNGTEQAHGCWCTREPAYDKSFLVQSKPCPPSITFLASGKNKTNGTVECSWFPVVRNLTYVYGVNLTEIYFYSPDNVTCASTRALRGVQGRTTVVSPVAPVGRNHTCGAFETCVTCKYGSEGNCVNNAFRNVTGRHWCRAAQRSCEHNGFPTQAVGRNLSGAFFEVVFDLDPGCSGTLLNNGGSYSLGGFGRWRGRVGLSGEVVMFTFHDNITHPAAYLGIPNIVSPPNGNLIRVSHRQDVLNNTINVTAWVPICAASSTNCTQIPPGGSFNGTTNGTHRLVTYPTFKLVNSTSLRVEIVADGKVQYDRTFSVRLHPSYNGLNTGFLGTDYQQVYVTWTTRHLQVLQWAQQRKLGTYEVIVRANATLALPKKPLMWSWGSVSLEPQGGNNFNNRLGDGDFNTILKNDEVYGVTCKPS